MRTVLKLLLPAVLLPVLFALACSNGSVSGSGGGLDIGNPAKVCVVDSLNHPVRNALVKMVISDGWFATLFAGDNVVADSAVTDAAGYARFDSLRQGVYTVQVDHGAGGALVRNVIMDDSLFLPAVNLRRYGSIAGTLGSDGSPVSRVRVAGTAYSASVNSDGSYLLAAVAPDDSARVIVAAEGAWSSGRNVTVTSSSTTGYSDTLTFSSLLLDDFEGAAGAGLSTLIGNTHWYAQKADVEGTSVQYSVVADGEGGGHVLSGKMITKSRWALVGLSIGIKPDGDSTWDFTGASGFSFSARGKGTLNVSFESDSIDRMGDYKHYSCDVVLDSVRHRHTISFDSLYFKKDANPDPDITWKASAGTIKRIEFNALADDTLEFMLDDLEVDGVDLSKVYGPRFH